MPHGSRISFLILLAAFVTPAGVAAQSNVVTPSPPPREGTVGPEQLRDFSLPGTQTQPAQDAPETAPQRSEPPAAAATPDRDTQSRAESTATAGEPRRTVTTAVTEVAPPPPEAVASRPSSALTVGLTPPAQSPATESAAPVFTPAFTPTPVTAAPADSGSSLSPVSGGDGSSPFAWWPWLLAALAVAGAAIFFVRRQREEQDGTGLAFAGGAPAAMPVQPRPAPPRAAPRPMPAPPVRSPAPAPAAPKPVGVVSTRLRPWVEIEMLAERAILTEEEAIIEFELVITNSGSAPARHVVVEAVALNAGATQDQEIATFFDRPDNSDGGIEVVPPLGRVALRNRVRMPRTAIREYAMEGRRLLVPVIAFNAGYRWSGSTGRSSAAFLVGRGGEDAEKMGPLRLDLGPREFRPLTQRRLDPSVRR